MDPEDAIRALRENADVTERSMEFLADEEMQAEAQDDIDLWRGAADALDTLTDELAEMEMRWRGMRDCYDVEVLRGGVSARERDAALRDAQQLRDALAEIVGHPVVSERGDENCDWHCTAEIVALATAALSSEGQPRDEKGEVCGKQMRGLYGALSICSRPAGHPFRCDSVWDSREWTEGGQPRETQQGADE